MTLTDQELENFVGGELTHCGEEVTWGSCDEHEDCSAAVCLECKNSWCDTDEGVK